jgi:triosephosphate isomerase (TIM)
MRTPIIAGNWKMYKTPEEAVSLLRCYPGGAGCDQRRGCCSLPAGNRHYPAVATALEGSRIGLGAQNMHAEDEGAYTGELAPEHDYAVLPIRHLGTFGATSLLLRDG